MDPTLVRPPATSRSRGARLLRRTAAAGVAAALLALVCAAAAWLATPGVGDARERVDALLAAHGAPALEGELPERIARAVLATEDSRFADHPGVDWRGALRAPWGVLTGEDLGGSTLDQQLAKNLYEDGADDAPARLRSVVLAVKLDAHWSKEELLRMYLDTAYFGHGFWGVTAASEGYFGVPPDELSWPQASLLAGLLQAPSAYDPLVHPDRAAARQAHVLDRLVHVGELTRAEADEVGAAPWGLVTG
ncbi:biosynthetic peptidoglycan transglycosylase [Trujillonella endophytica]|uniref:Penicillin-binding protein 1A n=1 Tax=Trujillonella endophytica TaxID=673521 RepID=A0A1H8S0K5_9ACTN|nr:biosynthetic peptidoglycan transglycosylase [Trujillella endophytica]SEO72076.1 penicillin-binding protein 1A [Trujillella endophytica]